ncbi:hypothetical protein [Paenibacillus sinensis]|uniref:hypothetical protein n=2 Tax=Paenibacillus TaxID=44249 RepID=UPI001CA869F9|nr:hypothetical protein [Paenibacillus sinensis]
MDGDLMAQWSTYPKGIDTRGDNRVETKLTGGVYTGINSFDIKDNQSVNEYGWDTDEFFPAKSTALGPTAYGSSGGAITRLLTSFGNVHMVRAVGAKLQYDNAGTWTDIAGTYTNTVWQSANFDVGGAALILTNGTDTVKYWNGSSLQDLTAAPKGRIIAADNLRVFISGVTGENGDEIHYSAFQNATDWSSAENSGIVQYYTANGGPLTAMIAFGGQIWVFKKDSFALIYHTGDARAFYRLVPSSDNIGCINSNTLVDMGSALMWLASDDVYIGAAGSANRIGEPVRTFINRINQSAIGNACAFSDGIRYYLCLPIDGSTYPNIRLVYDQRFQIWSVSRINENFLFGINFNDKVYAADSSGQTFNVKGGPTSSTSMVETKDFDRSEAEKEYDQMHLQYYANSGTSLTIQVSVDQGTTWYTVGDPITASASAQNQNVIIPLDVVPLANWIRFRFIVTGTFRLYGFERWFKTHPVQY